MPNLALTLFLNFFPIVMDHEELNLECDEFLCRISKKFPLFVPIFAPYFFPFPLYEFIMLLSRRGVVFS